MEKLKGVKKISLYSSEAASILSSEGLHFDLTNRKTVIAEEAPPLSYSPPPQSLSAHCTSCDATFTRREEQVDHYASDWHRFNLKRKLKGLASLSQDEFEGLSDDLSSISGSESDSDPDTSDHTIRSPIITFTFNTTCHAIYRVLVTNSKDVDLSVDELKQAMIDLTIPQFWIILMRSGGHFAGAVFKGSTVVDHKTFHRYTVRAKRGTIQSSRDAHQGGHKPRSAGASLRRYNEAALEQEIDQLILSWKQYIDKATLIFTRAPKHTKYPFTSGKNSPIISGDPRVRNIPFMTRRPTFSQVKFVQLSLSTLYCGLPVEVMKTHSHSKTDTHATIDVGSIECLSDTIQIQDVIVDQDETCLDKTQTEIVVSNSCELDTAVTPKGKKKRRKPKDKVEKINESVILLHELSQSNNVNELIKLLKEKHCLPLSTASCIEPSTNASIEPSTNASIEPSTGASIVPSTGTSIEPSTSASIEPSTGASIEPSTGTSIEPSTGASIEPSTSVPLDINAVINSSTALHIASTCGHIDIIYLLLVHGADPSIKNGDGKVPYILAKDKLTRNCFRRFMNDYPEACDYIKAQVPSPLTPELEQTHKDKKSEKRKQQKKAQKKKKDETKLQEDLKQSEMNQVKTLNSLSDRERRALAAEKRMIGQVPSLIDTRYGSCSWCNRRLCGLVPFERLEYKYCSIECVREHRLDLLKNKS